MKHSLSLFAAFACIAAPCALPRYAYADEAAPAAMVRPLAPLTANQICDLMLDALRDHDFAAFKGAGDENVQRAITQELFDKASNLIAAREKAGYEKVYLDHLKKKTGDLYLWKLQFKDGGDDLLVQMTLKDGKVAGFFFA